MKKSVSARERKESHFETMYLYRRAIKSERSHTKRKICDTSRRASIVCSNPLLAYLIYISALYIYVYVHADTRHCARGNNHPVLAGRRERRWVCAAVLEFAHIWCTRTNHPLSLADQTPRERERSNNDTCVESSCICATRERVTLTSSLAPSISLYLYGQRLLYVH